MERWCRVTDVSVDNILGLKMNKKEISVFSSCGKACLVQEHSNKQSYRSDLYTLIQRKIWIQLLKLMPAVCSTPGTYMPDGVCQSSITMSLPCQYVPLHQWDLGKALELTMTQGNSLDRAFRFLCPEDAMEKQERKKKHQTVTPSYQLSVILAFLYVSSVLFVLPLWAQYYSLLFDCCLNPLWVIFLRMVFWISKWLYLNWTWFPIHRAVGCTNPLLNMTIFYSFPLAWTVFIPF